MQVNGAGGTGNPRGSPTWGLQEAGGPHSHSGGLLLPLSWGMEVMGDPGVAVLAWRGQGGPQCHHPGSRRGQEAPRSSQLGVRGGGELISVPGAGWGWETPIWSPGLVGAVLGPQSALRGWVKQSRARRVPGPGGGGAPGTGDRDRDTPRSPPGDHSRSGTTGTPGPHPVLRLLMSHPCPPTAAPGHPPAPRCDPDPPPLPHPGCWSLFRTVGEALWAGVTPRVPPTRFMPGPIWGRCDPPPCPHPVSVLVRCDPPPPRVPTRSRFGPV